jgi:hypothetical protein
MQSLPTVSAVFNLLSQGEKKGQLGEREEWRRVFFFFLFRVMGLAFPRHHICLSGLRVTAVI